MVVETREFSNDITTLRSLTDWIQAYAADARLSTAVQERLDLCVHEAIVNVIRHGYEPGAHGSIAVSLEAHDRGVQVTIADDGRAFDPISYPSPHMAETILDASAGGFGIHLIRSFSDGLEYRRDGADNVLIMRFHERDAT